MFDPLFPMVGSFGALAFISLVFLVTLLALGLGVVTTLVLERQREASSALRLIHDPGFSFPRRGPAASWRRVVAAQKLRTAQLLWACH